MYILCTKIQFIILYDMERFVISYHILKYKNITVSIQIMNPAILLGFSSASICICTCMSVGECVYRKDFSSNLLFPLGGQKYHTAC